MQDSSQPDIEKIVATLKSEYVLIPKKKVAWLAGALAGFVAVNFGGSWATALSTAGTKLGEAFDAIDDVASATDQVAAATADGFRQIEAATPEGAPRRIDFTRQIDTITNAREQKLQVFTRTPRG